MRSSSARLTTTDGGAKPTATATATANDAAGPTRRSVLQGGLAAGAAGIALATFGETPAGAATGAAASASTINDARIRPFRVSVPQQQLLTLRRKVAETRWPAKELVTDRSQGVQLATAQALAKFWTTRYDWRRFEEKLNKLPQYKTEIDGVDIHFIHVRSPHEDALPLIMTHGWPGSIVEMLDAVGPLTNPTKHGGRAADAFHLVVPSIPGYGFSGQPTELGWGPARIAQAWTELMRRLGYSQYVAQGGDVGAAVTDTLGRQAPAGLLGIHMNLLVPALGGAVEPKETAEEQSAAAALDQFRATGSGYLIEQNTRPQTIGYSLLDSPVGLATWMLDHDTDSYYKSAGAFVDGKPSGNLTREHILDNITTYWLTGTGASAARVYWEGAHPQGGRQVPPPVTVPVGFSAFPGEIFVAPRSWVENAYPTLTYYNKPARGGHFAAWEEPLLFTNEVRNAFRALR
ncbi:epoxide hydrolase family protein [Kribbella sp. NPDC006257]|uniref:epoxide hydrolase family protein n=1 Tax=Kribbella sp. NPDC006257 TaxID=3156738 RepID=UPI0033B9356C